MLAIFILSVIYEQVEVEVLYYHRGRCYALTLIENAIWQRYFYFALLV
jgi:hypothetical protein